MTFPLGPWRRLNGKGRSIGTSPCKMTTRRSGFTSPAARHTCTLPCLSLKRTCLLVDTTPSTFSEPLFCTWSECVKVLSDRTAVDRRVRVVLGGNDPRLVCDPRSLVRTFFRCADKLQWELQLCHSSLWATLTRLQGRVLPSGNSVGGLMSEYPKSTWSVMEHVVDLPLWHVLLLCPKRSSESSRANQGDA